LSLRDAFEAILSRHSRSVTLLRRPASGPDISGTVKVSPSNYFRNLQGPDNLVIEGREFVITKTSLEAAGFTVLRRGDILQDSELGESVIDQIREMYDLGGAVIGYRCTTS
jgi:hypothetical protein